MHILNPMLCYNSIDILPYVIDYHKKEDIDLFIIDNYSNDGSWEYIQDSKIPSTRINTNGIFDLGLLLDYKTEIIHKIKPDWIINTECDMFIITPGSISDIIKEINNFGFQIISTPFLRFFNTGENRLNLDHRKIFFYYRKDNDPLLKIHSYKNFINYYADRPIMDNDHSIAQTDMILFLDYGNTRLKEKRQEIYQKTKIAWNMKIMPKNFCEHLRDCSQRNWIWNKNELNDIRESNYWELTNYKFNGAKIEIYDDV